ncbi:GntR family transcriptional regulator [Kriegella aquimaris]|uniref:Substrate-binding protein-like domain-containing protein n=1 Tax=Kriegella aquimaris TaxID=192904 RepID=A0A1G9TNY8_9FLAO|nr:GntR family transcriptional regulator [Kriegella aquimaris]SDM49413.1 substrate-binding protein-like domain-containing protein [Kriegella aquimaris]
MKSKIEIDVNSKEPIYKQLVKNIQYLIENGIYKKGDYVPSLNDLSFELHISKETVKKAYSILREKMFLESTQGKGYYISFVGNHKMRILLILDRLGSYKQAMYNAFSDTLGVYAEITIRLHNQDISTFEDFLEDSLDHFDYYVITSHFPLVPDIQKRALNTLKRIPNRKLILLDTLLPKLSGNFGAVYQDYQQDIYNGLHQGLTVLKKYQKLNVISMSGSLYAPYLHTGIKKFCADYDITYEIHNEVNPSKINKNEAFLILNGQLDSELIELVEAAKSRGYSIGSEIGIISYNESPINEIILNGLTVLSTDFEQMGKLAAQMILGKSFSKIKCDFRLVRRNSF